MKSELTDIQKAWKEIDCDIRFKTDEGPIIHGDTYFEFTKAGKRYRIGITEVKPKTKRVTKKKK